MKIRSALPGVIVGLVGLITALAGLALGVEWLFVPAAACCVLGAAVCVQLARRLDDAQAKVSEIAEQVTRSEAESDHMAARAARFEAESIAARAALADSMRAEAAHRISAEDAANGDGVTDSETGLFNEPFFLVTLDKRVSAARRGLRPLAAVRLEVVTDVDHAHPAPASVVAVTLNETLRDADTACRLEDGTFALVLEDTPENGAVWTVERIRRCLADRLPGTTLWAGVACYPAHAFDSHQILVQATEALDAAKEWRQDRIEVATAAED